MKTLLLLRHAKSSWEYPELSDLERPLNQRGKKDAPNMGKWLKNNIEVPDLVLSSPSVRTLATISKVGHEWGLSGHSYQTDHRLYHASPNVLEQIVRTCESDIKNLLLVGHNPGLTEFANLLCPNQAVVNIPTCGVYGIRFKTDTWKNLSPQNATFLFFQYPKKL